MKNLLVVIAVAGLAVMACPTDPISVPMATNAPIVGQGAGLFDAIRLKADQWCRGVLNDLSGPALYAADNGEDEEKEDEDKKDEEKQAEEEPPGIDRLWAPAQFG